MPPPKSGKLVCYVCDKRASLKDRVSLHVIPERPDVREKWFTALDLFPGDNVSTVRVCSKHFSDKDLYPDIGPFVTRYRRLMPTAVPSRNMQGLKIRFDSDCDASDTEQNDNDMEQSEDPAPTPAVVEIVDLDHDYPVIVQQQTQVNVNDVGEPPKVHISQSTQKHQKSKTVEFTCNSCKNKPYDPWEEEKELSELNPKRIVYEPRYITELRTMDMSTPDKARRIIKMVQQQSEKQIKKIKSLQDTNRSLLRKLHNLQVKAIKKAKRKEQKLIIYKQNREIITCLQATNTFIAK